LPTKYENHYHTQGSIWQKQRQPRHHQEGQGQTKLIALRDPVEIPIYIYIYGTIEEEENIFLVAINAFAPFIESKVQIFFNLQKGFDGYGLYLPWVTNDGDRWKHTSEEILEDMATNFQRKT